jgi:hypothetical protein
VQSRVSHAVFSHFPQTADDLFATLSLDYDRGNNGPFDMRDCLQEPRPLGRGNASAIGLDGENASAGVVSKCGLFSKPLVIFQRHVVHLAASANNGRYVGHADAHNVAIPISRVPRKCLNPVWHGRNINGSLLVVRQAKNLREQIGNDNTLWCLYKKEVYSHHRAIPQSSSDRGQLAEKPSLADTLEMPKRSSKKKRARDPNQLAKSIVDQATGEAPEKPDDGKNPAAVALGRLGGKKGGLARAKKLSKAQRSEIARKAALSRWKSKARK